LRKKKLIHKHKVIKEMLGEKRDGTEKGKAVDPVNR